MRSSGNQIHFSKACHAVLLIVTLCLIGCHGSGNKVSQTPLTPADQRRTTILKPKLSTFNDTINASDELAEKYYQPVTSLPSMFGHHAVLQRQKPLRIFGKDQPAQTVTVTLLNQGVEFLTTESLTDETGRWFCEFPPQEAGGPYSMVVKGTEILVSRNVMIGDVWVLSGQSNMEWALINSLDGKKYAANADNPNIRFLKSKYDHQREPSDNLAGVWLTVDPVTVQSVSAIGYHFASILEAQQNVPIGIIQSAIGGSHIESWLPPESFTKDFYRATYYQKFSVLEPSKEVPSPASIYAENMSTWLFENLKTFDENDAIAKGWHTLDHDVSEWPAVELPGRLETSDQVSLDGIFWYAKSIELTNDWLGSDLQLSLGIIDDYDEVYFNGHLIGSTGLETQASWCQFRQYRVPAGIVKEGKNRITIKVLDVLSGGGLAGPKPAMNLSSTDPNMNEILPLDGTWHYAIDALIPNDRSRAPESPFVINNSLQYPSAMHYAMMSPIMNLPVKGFAWYQGESNAPQATHYRPMLMDLIDQFRIDPLNNENPFLIVQISAFGKEDNADYKYYPKLREAQFEAAQEKENTWIVASIDKGDKENIHPPQKKPIGQRLAGIALGLESNSEVLKNHPTYHPVFHEFSELENGVYEIQFNQAGENLSQVKLNEEIEDTDVVRGIYSANSDGNFYEADAWIENNTIQFKPNHEGQVVDIRYNFLESPSYYLVNDQDLPVFPFRTDKYFQALQIPLEIQ